MSESKHSDSEFYYPSELSDAEMLQLLTHNEATERKTLLSNHEDACETKQCCHAHVLIPPKKWKRKKMVIWYNAYWLSEVGPDGKIFGSPSGRMHLIAFGLYVLTTSQIFSCLALPLSQ